MGNIIDINKYKLDRDRYEFKGRTVLLHDEYQALRKYSCIVLEDRNSGDIVSYTGLERYVVDLSDVTLGESTYSYAESRVRGFLNYILHETDINFIHEISLNDIRRYLEYRRIDEKGEEVTSDAWGRIRSDVNAFLMNYYKHNKDKVPFHYSPDNLMEIAIVKEKTDRGTRKHVISRYKTLGIKEPKKNNNCHRKRTIMHGHLEAMLYAARKYDPMIHLAICLMAYAGLREGEVVNLSFSDIRLSGGLGIVDKIEIDLKDSDKFRKGKTHTGVIKKIREQLVFTDFIDAVEEAIEFHKDYLEAKGLPTEGKNAVFYNKQGRPMSVTTLLSRIKDLFVNHFLRVLKETSESTEFEGETYAFIEAYEDEYPGAHMFRHWFTMYLITKKKMKRELVIKWRGDAPDSNAYEQYMHLNYDLIEAYRKTAYGFQESLLKEIYD